ncbi:MAG TPA: hypothetical protein VHT70_02735 [Candidatus Saccharimonadales bacterium]|jgi:hypothetical protein|nr:hypothetical protein [Candidatus Saccharimonadales bacterium]
MQKQIASIMQKEVTRKEFLTALGFGVVSILGFSSIVKLLTGKGFNHSVDVGYGASVYGGKK